MLTLQFVSVVAELQSVDVVNLLLRTVKAAYMRRHTYFTISTQTKKRLTVRITMTKLLYSDSIS